MWEKKSKNTFFTEQFERLVPVDDKFRVLRENIDFSFVNEMARPYYSDLGQTGYPPEKLFRCLLAMFLDAVSSERKLEEKLKFDIRFRYFCDLDIYDPIPDHATFSLLRSRLGDELFHKIFETIVEKASDLGFLRKKHIAIDSTSVIADCCAPRKKRTVDKDQKPPSDPDASWGVKAKLPTHFGYKAHYLVDVSTDFILDTETTTASTADIVVGKALIKRKSASLLPDYLSADKAYSSAAWRDQLKHDYKITPIIPLRGGGSRKGFFTKDKFIPGPLGLKCPAGRILKQVGRDHKRDLAIYAGSDCLECKLKGSCTKADSRSVTLSLLDPNQETAAFNASDLFSDLYRQRSSVERVNANAKVNHGLRRARYRTLPKVRFQVIMTAIAVNLKKMAKWFELGSPRQAKLA